MCSEPVTRAPLSGWRSACSRRVAMRPGISCSASWISLRPNAASDRSATLKSPSATVAGRPSIGAPGVPGVRVLVIDAPVVRLNDHLPYAAFTPGPHRHSQAHPNAAREAVSLGGLLHLANRPAHPPGLVPPHAARTIVAMTLRTKKTTARSRGVNL